MNSNPDGTNSRGGRRQVRHWLMAMLSGASLLLIAGPSFSQEMRAGSLLAGVAWPVSSYDWPDDASGAKRAVLDQAAAAVGKQCSETQEFNAWDMSGEDQPEQFVQSILGSYDDAGWKLTQSQADGDAYAGARDGVEIVVWLNLDAERHRLALFTCRTNTSVAPGKPPRNGLSAVAPADDAMPILRALGYLALLAGFAFLVLGIRRRRKAVASKDWNEVPATILNSRIEKRTVETMDDETTWYTPLVQYAYTIGGVEHGGQQLRLHSSKTTNRKRAEAAIAKYPVDAQVTIRVNPANPGEATLETDPPRFGAFLPIAVLFALAGAGLVAIESVLVLL